MRSAVVIVMLSVTGIFTDACPVWGQSTSDPAELELRASQTQKQDRPKSNAKKADAKKKPQPFRWVNKPGAKSTKLVQHSTFRSQANDAEVGFCIYLPPGYTDSENRDRRYPVVYWLHGGRPGSELKSVSIAPFVDQAIKSGKTAPKIYVFPNGGKLSHYNHGSFLGETAFLELVKHVDQTYRTIADRSGRAVEGFSQGGRGAGRYMFKHSNLFCSAAPMGGGHQHEKRISESDGVESESVTIKPAWNNTWDLARKYSSNADQLPKILVAVGTEDFNFEANQEWGQLLSELKVPHEFIVVEDAPHSARLVYEKVGGRVMRFHDRNFAETRELTLESSKK